MIHDDIPHFARAQNPELDQTDVRLRSSKFTVAVIDAEVHHRNRTTDPNASRNLVVNEILDAWAREQWHRANMTLKLAPSNPHAADSQKECP